MAEQTDGRIRIEAPPEAVMAVITAFAEYPEWAQGVKRTTVRKRDPKGRGKEVEFEVAQMGIGATYTLTYRYAPRSGGVSWTSKAASGAVRSVEGEYELRRDGGATEVTYRARVEPAVALPGFMRRQAEKQIVKTALDGLKKRVESR